MLCFKSSVISGCCVSFHSTSRAFCGVGNGWFVSLNLCSVKLILLIWYFVARLYSFNSDYKWKPNGKLTIYFWASIAELHVVR